MVKAESKEYLKILIESREMENTYKETYKYETTET